MSTSILSFVLPKTDWTIGRMPYIRKDAKKGLLAPHGEWGVQDCEELEWVRLKQGNQNTWTPLQLFPAHVSLASLQMDNLAHLHRSLNGKKSGPVMTYLSLKSITAVPISKMTACNSSSLFMCVWIISYGIPAHLSRESCMQLVIKLSETTRAFSGTKHLMTR